MSAWVYVIRSESTGKIYIGQTVDLEKRLARHNLVLPQKSSAFTSKNRGPWRLVYREPYLDRAGALKREKELKSFRGREFLKNLIMPS